MLSFAVAGSSASSPVPAACDAPSSLRRLIVRAAAVTGLAIGAWLLCSMLAAPHASADTGATGHPKTAPAATKSGPAKGDRAGSLISVLTNVLADTTTALTHPAQHSATTHRAPAAPHTGHAASSAGTHSTSTAAATHPGATHAGATTTPAQPVDPLTALLRQLSPVTAPVTTVVDQTARTVTDVADQLLQPLLGPTVTLPTAPPVSSVPTPVLSLLFGGQPATMTATPAAGTHTASDAAHATQAGNLLTGPSRNALTSAVAAPAAHHTSTDTAGVATTPLGHAPVRTPSPAPTDPGPAPAPSGPTGTGGPVHAALPGTVQLVPAHAAQSRSVLAADRPTRLRTSEAPVWPD
ncbi:MAG: hypothetical protein ACR2KJ_18250 [Jatrophihabitans sp.]